MLRDKLVWNAFCSFTISKPSFDDSETKKKESFSFEEYFGWMEEEEQTAVRGIL